MLLYIHVPFCRSKCGYCAFASAPASSFGPEGPGAAEAAWEAAVRAEMQLQRDATGCADVETIFFGGGTPSFPDAERIARILADARRLFRVAPDAEISMEANPDSVTPQKALIWREAGVNRISLGVQALDDGLLKSIGRVHDAGTARRAFRVLRSAGFGNIGLDLIWGLPGESRESWRRQLEEAAAMAPEHLSCYALTLEEGTPLFSRRHELALPPEDGLAGMYEDTGEILDRHGFSQYEISNYARPGFRCRHNCGYWEGKDYLGLGPSAVGTSGGVRKTNPASMEEWASAVARGEIPGTSEPLGFRERLEEFVMLGLRTSDGLDLDEYARRSGHSFLTDNGPFIEALEREGLARLEGNRLALARRGMLVSNGIISSFFEGIPEQPDACRMERTAHAKEEDGNG